MARLGDGVATPAGLAGACSAMTAARRHPMVTMNSEPCPGLTKVQTWPTNFVTLCVLLNALWDSRCCPFYTLLVPAGNDTPCLQPKGMLIMVTQFRTQLDPQDPTDPPYFVLSTDPWRRHPERAYGLSHPSPS